MLYENYMRACAVDIIIYYYYRILLCNCTTYIYIHACTYCTWVRTSTRPHTHSLSTCCTSMRTIVLFFNHKNRPLQLPALPPLCMQTSVFSSINFDANGNYIAEGQSCPYMAGSSRNDERWQGVWPPVCMQQVWLSSSLTRGL